MRTVPPARSPISAASLARGLVASATGAGREPLVRRLNEIYDAERGVLTDSGTSALTLALRAARDAGFSPVALPAYCCYDLVTAAVGADAPVLLYDLVPETLEPDSRSLAAAVDAGARTLVVAHLFGVPISTDRLRSFCDDRGLLLVEDAAQEGGSRIAGRRAGSFGTLTVLSFGRGKGLTGGSGGALLARGQGAELLAGAGEPRGGRGFRDVVASTALWTLGRPALFGVPRAIPGLRVGETVYKTPHAPAGISAAAATIVSANIGLQDVEISRRRRTAEELAEACVGPAVRAVRPDRPDVEPGWLRAPVLLAGDARRSAATEEAAKLGIAEGYPLRLDQLEPLGPLLRNAGTDFPGAIRLAAGLCTLPVHGWVTGRDRSAIEQWLASLTTHPAAASVP